MPSSHLTQFIGGLALFFFGLFSMYQSLHGFAGDRLKGIVARTTEGRLKSLVTGLIGTIFLQSSSAVTVMTVGMASSGLLAVENAMAVSLGAGIGTTFVVLLLSVKGIVENGLLILVFGLLLRFVSSKRVIRTAGDVLFSFGLIFFGLTIMSQATSPLKESVWIPQVIQFMQDYPAVNLFIAAVLTALVHSSTAVLGILISMAFAGTITFDMAVPLVLGANVGTSFTAIMASFNSRTEGKRVAWANLLNRVGAVLIIYPFLQPFSELMHQVNHVILKILLHVEVTMAAEIALFHLLFNLLVVIVFLPFIDLGKKGVEWLIPKKMDEDDVFGPRYLDHNALATPTLAFAETTREVVRMGEIVQRMFAESLSLFQKYDLDRVDEIKASDHKVDTLYKAIKFYLAKLSLEKLTEEQSSTSLQLMTAVNELENIGDTIDRHIVRLAHKRLNKGVGFSEEGWKEICDVHRGTAEMLELALAAFAAGNRELAQKMETHFNHFSDFEDELKMSHLMRLNEGIQRSIDTSSIHLELLAIFHRINLSLLTMVKHLLGERGG